MENSPSSIDPVLSGYLRNTAPVLYFVLDPRGRILEWNTAAADVCGRELEGKSIKDIIFSIPRDLKPEDLADGKEHLFHVATVSGPDETYYFTFLPSGSRFIAVGRFDMNEIAELKTKVTRVSSEVTQLNRELHKQNAALDQSRERLEQTVQKRTEQLKRLSTRLLDAHEEERKRIAADLHDGLAQTLSTVQVWIGAALADMGSDIHGAVRSLESARKLAQNAIDEVQTISRNLRPSMLDNLGLLATLQWLCDGFEKVYPHIGIRKELDVPETMVPDPLKIVIFRITQEALNNAGKHSGASKVTVRLSDSAEGKGDRLSLMIGDNGSGFDPDKIKSARTTPGGMGLDTMRERTELSGGSYTLESVPGDGTKVEAIWSLK